MTWKGSAHIQAAAFIETLKHLGKDGIILGWIVLTGQHLQVSWRQGLARRAQLNVDREQVSLSFPGTFACRAVACVEWLGTAERQTVELQGLRPSMLLLHVR